MQNWCLKVEWRQPKPGNLLWARYTVGYSDNLPIARILTQTNLMRSKPVRFWSIAAGYAELIFEGEMKTANAWQPTMSSLPVGILTIFQSRAFWRKLIQWDQSLYVSEVVRKDMQNWCLKVEWIQPKPGNLLSARYLWGFWQYSIRAHFDANQSNEIKACTFLKCWARICRIDVWRWNEDSQSLATYCELATLWGILTIFQSRSFWRKPIKWDQSLYVSEVLSQDMQNWCLKVEWRQPKPGNLLWAGYTSSNGQSSKRAHFDANQSNEIKACTFLKYCGRICRIDLWKWNEDSQRLATYCELATLWGILTIFQSRAFWRKLISMRSKLVRFWSSPEGYAELMFEGGMKTAKAWQPTVSWKPSIDWQSSNRAHFDANQSNEIKACTFLKCWARICRIDVWRWNEDSQSLATYCELATCGDSDNLPIALILTQTNQMRSKPVRFWSVEPGYAELMFEGGMKTAKAWQPTVSWLPVGWSDNLPIALILTQTNQMRSKPVRFWSVEPGYAELMFEGGMKTAKAWQPTVSSLPVGILTIFQSRQSILTQTQSNEIKACTFLKCWARICRIDVWRWNEDSQSLATYCELATCDNLPIDFDANQSNEIKACTFVM